MSDIDVGLRQTRATVLDGTVTKYQVTTRILFVEEKGSDPVAYNPDNIPDGNMLDVYAAPPLFLLKKLTSETTSFLHDETQVEYIRLASPEDFRSFSPFDPTLTGGHAWYAYAALPGMPINNETTGYAGTPDTDEAGYSDSTMDQVNCTEKSYFVSGVLVRRFINLKDADDHAEDIQNALKDFKTNYSTILDLFSNMNVSPGWDTYTYS